MALCAGPGVAGHVLPVWTRASTIEPAAGQVVKCKDGEGRAPQVLANLLESCARPVSLPTLHIKH